MTGDHLKSDRAAFVRAYASRSGLSDEWADLGFIQIGARYRIAMPCDCGHASCIGWQMVGPDAVSDIALDLIKKNDRFIHAGLIAT